MGHFLDSGCCLTAGGIWTKEICELSSYKRETCEDYRKQCFSWEKHLQQKNFANF